MILQVLATADLIKGKTIGIDATTRGRGIRERQREAAARVEAVAQLALTDTTDPCRFDYFTDQAGIIYTAQPIR